MILTIALLLLQEEAPSFGKDQRLAAAYYQLLPDARHEAELLEMGKAGVDLALIAVPAKIEALDPLIAALDALAKDGKKTPKLAPVATDLPTAETFLARVSRHAARIDGRPLVWLSPGGDPGRMKERPYLVAEVSRKDATADRTYAAGTRGFGIDLPVVSVTPGSGNREDGRVYERLWYKAVKLESKFVAIESWNGAADGVNETTDRKRKYLDLTHRFIRDFKVNEKPVLAKGKWTAATQVAYTVVYNPHEQGLRPVPVDDGLIDEVRLRGFEALSTKENKKGTVRRMCFDVDDSFCYFDKRSFEVAVEFLDLGEGSFSLEYDSADKTIGPEERVVKRAGTVRFTGSGQWKTESFKLPDAMFGNSQPGGSDFRLVVDQRGLSVRAVMVLKR
jgi:hypothetical protein